MRVLFLSPSLPYPQDSGFKIRVYQCLKLLSQRHAVSLLAFESLNQDDNRAAVAALSEFCAAVHTIPPADAGGGSRRFRQMASLVSSRSYQGHYLYSAAAQAKLDDVCARERFDIIQMESSQWGSFRFDPRAATVLAEHDVVYELLERIAHNERSVFRRVFNGAEYRKFKTEERALWRRVSACVVTSARDLATVRESGVTTPVVAVPNAVDADYFQPSDDAVDNDAIVMTGFMATRPNTDGAIFAVESILPHILKRRPKTVLYLVGGDPPDEVTRLEGPHVVVTGSVADVRPYVRRAAVSIVPLRMGGGTRLKILEGLAMKKPIVSTTVGSEGLDVTHGEHLLIADAPEAFADAVVRLMDDQAFGSRLGNAGYQRVHEQYRWQAAVATLERLYEQLCVSAV